MPAVETSAIGRMANIGERGQEFTCLDQCGAWIYLDFSCFPLIFWVFWLMNFIASQPLIAERHLCPNSQVLAWTCLLDGGCYFYFVCSIFNPCLRPAIPWSLCSIWSVAAALALGTNVLLTVFIEPLFLFLYFSFIEVLLGSFSSGPVLLLQPFIFLLWFSIL